ncbi:MAG: O-antigen ligase domain-containing protein [Xanthobacteraceae bacterium]|nr:O-antigen ligase domain-containing protein [Xanthobacteraceae bacterium]
METAARDLRISGERLRCALLWLTGASGAIVFIEPSPYEISTFLSLIMFAIGGLTLSPVLMPLVFLLVLVNIGYSISGATVIGEPGVIAWLVTSWYLAVTAVFFAAMLTQNTEARLRAITAGCVVGGLIASFAAIFGYFRVVPSLNELLLLYDRARGTFKDPNVLGAFLVFPALLCLLMVASARFGRALRGAMMFGFIGIAVLLSFSRAAWGQTAYAAALMFALIFVTTRSPPQRLRIVLLILVGSVVLAAAIAALLSIDAVAQLFVQRASFSQSYDVGAQGRFARHFLGAIMALDYPVGIGPLQFNKYFPEDPHNSYLNAFMAGGWLGGVAYPALVFLTVGFGFRTVFIRTPYQQTTIAVFSGYFGVATESFIIDTDHWRHTFLLMGLMWGLIAASRGYARLAGSPELASARPAS